jgi:O-methyltransferase domain/Dimerisation domain
MGSAEGRVRRPIAGAASPQLAPLRILRRGITTESSTTEPIMTEPTPQDLMQRMMTGYWLSQAIYVAAKLRVADRLADAPQSIEVLSEATGTHPPALYRLLRALASVGIFSEDDQGSGKFGLTPAAETLRSDAPGSLWSMAIMMGEEHYHAWGGLLESVRTGKTAFDRLYGKPVFAYLTEHPEKARIFDASMTAIHGRETAAVLDAYDFSDIGVLADIGGGNGSNLIGMLGRYPGMRGVLFDLPHVVERAEEAIRAAGLTGRCEAVGGSFFKPIPVEADAYFLRHIIHDWDDEDAGRILRNIRLAMPPGARLLLVEHVLPPGNAPSFGKLLDLNMLIVPGGVERTEDEFRRLYEAAGFRLNRVVPAQGDLSVIEGLPA